MTYNFTADCRVAILQARFEALAQGSSILEPSHLILGVTKSISEALFDRLFVAPDQFTGLCVALGSTPIRAPVSSVDIVYTEAAKEVLAGAMHAAGGGRPVWPLHILIGVFDPQKPFDAGAASVSPAAKILAASGLTQSHLEGLAASIAREVA